MSVALAPTAAPAQTHQPPSGRPWFATVSHYGRWAALAAAGGLIGLAVTNHNSANDTFDRLEGFCQGDPSRCALRVAADERSSIYADPEAEAMFQEYAQLRRRARGYLLGGQLSLVAAGGMFVIDLIYRKQEPKNIPLTPLELFTGPQELGFRVRF